MCGADHLFPLRAVPVEGSPPRVRSRPIWTAQDQDSEGITSACAEQTGGLELLEHLLRDHLRVCGADVLFCVG